MAQFQTRAGNQSNIDSANADCPSVTTGTEMPRERLRRCGPEALKDHELVAILLGTGYRGNGVTEVARSIVTAHPKEELMAMSLKALAAIKGIGQAKACVFVAAFELTRRGLEKGIGILPVISRPTDLLPALAEIKDQRREHFVCLYLNARNQVIYREVVSIGSLCASIVHPREVFLAAVQHSAASVILAHNHPSGDVSPSKADIDLTQRLVDAGRIMGIDVLDHIVVAHNDFISFKERGLL